MADEIKSIGYLKGNYIPQNEVKSNSIFFDEKNKRFTDMDHTDIISFQNYAYTFKNVSIIQ